MNNMTRNLSREQHDKRKSREQHDKLKEERTSKLTSITEVRHYRINEVRRYRITEVRHHGMMDVNVRITDENVEHPCTCRIINSSSRVLREAL